MTEPNTAIASTGAALVTLATVAAGPLLGEYIIVIFLGLLGSLIALTELPHDSFKKSLVFIFRGVTFSFIFTGIITAITIKYVGAVEGITPYALLGAISFSIGWTSNKWERIKDWLISLLTSRGQGSSSNRVNFDESRGSGEKNLNDPARRRSQSDRVEGTKGSNQKIDIPPGEEG